MVKMEQNRVMPDKAMGKQIKEIFGRRSDPVWFWRLEIPVNDEHVQTRQALRPLVCIKNNKGQGQWCKNRP